MGKMKIQHKLFLGFFVITFLIIIFGHIAMRLNKNIAINLKQVSQGSMIENMYASGGNQGDKIHSKISFPPLK